METYSVDSPWGQITFALDDPERGVAWADRLVVNGVEYRLRLNFANSNAGISYDHRAGYRSLRRLHDHKDPSRKAVQVVSDYCFSEAEKLFADPAAVERAHRFVVGEVVEHLSCAIVEAEKRIAVLRERHAELLAQMKSDRPRLCGETISKYNGMRCGLAANHKGLHSEQAGEVV